MKIGTCKDCGDPTPPSTRRPRLRCVECQKLQQADWQAGWRDRNPDRERANSESRRRRAGIRLHAEWAAARRQAAIKRAAEIAAVLAQGYSYSNAAKKMGLTKNTLIGAMDRARRYGYAQEAT